MNRRDCWLLVAIGLLTVVALTGFVIVVTGENLWRPSPSP